MKDHEKDYELVHYPNGTISLRQLSTGQSMHSSIGPWEEATQLYIEQSRLAERLQAIAPGQDGEPLCLWDVGLGLAANSIAALRCHQGLTGPRRPLRIVSFENDVKGLAAALDEIAHFPFLEPYSAILRALLDSRAWVSGDGAVRWELFEGEFHRVVDQAPEPEIIFYDFYAPRSCPPLWTLEAFEHLFRLTEGRRKRGLATDLYTYTAATPVRVAMLLSGFHVGYGRATAMKGDTTVASTRPESLAHPLDAEWLKKLDRSTKLAPFGWDPERDREKPLKERILACPQFARPIR